MPPERQLQANDEFLNEVFDLALRSLSTGEALDAEAVVSRRPHLREEILRILELARDVAVVESPRPATVHAPGVAGFTILEEVGRGGAGIVYRAVQDGLGRTVALKFLAPSLVASPRSRERFL